MYKLNERIPLWENEINKIGSSWTHFIGCKRNTNFSLSRSLSLSTRMRTLIGWHTFPIAISMNHGIEQKLALKYFKSVRQFLSTLFLSFRFSRKTLSLFFWSVGGTQKYCIIWSNEIMCIHRMGEVDTVEQRLYTDPTDHPTHKHIHSLHEFIDQKQFFVVCACLYEPPQCLIWICVWGLFKKTPYVHICGKI